MGGTGSKTIIGLAAAILIVALVLKMKKAGGPAKPTKPVAQTPGKTSPKTPLAPVYATVEALAEDHKKAFAGIPDSSAAVKELLTRYFVCKSFKKKDPSVCVPFDEWAQYPSGPMGEQPTRPCQWTHMEAMALKEVLTAPGSRDVCLAFGGLDSEGHDTAEDAAENCGDYAKFARRSDPAGLCKLEDSKEDEKACLELYTYLAGDPGRCANFAQQQKALCETKAKLVKALKDGEGAPVASTMYGPLIDQGSAACEALGKKVLAEYRSGVALRAENLKEKRESKKAAAREAARAAEEKAANEDAVKTLEEERRLRSQLAREEHEKWLREEEARKERVKLQRRLEMADKYEAARLADERKRKKKGRPMRSTKEPVRGAGGAPPGAPRSP